MEDKRGQSQKDFNILFLDHIVMASTSLPLKLVLLVGQLVLAAFYGTLGTILTFLQLLRIGPAKFFGRVQRPKPPAVATDPNYGTHKMITLKVMLFFFSREIPSKSIF